MKFRYTFLFLFTFLLSFAQDLKGPSAAQILDSYIQFCGREARIISYTP